MSANATRRDLLLGAAALAAPLAAGAAAPEPKADANKVYRVGVISAAIRGKPQPRNGHTWHFAQYLHPEINFDAVQKHYPQMLAYYKRLRDPRFNFDQLPFPDTRITHYYDADSTVSVPFTEVFPGVNVAKSVQEML